MDSPAELRRKVTETVVKNIIAGFTRQVEDIGQSKEPNPREIIFTGNLEMAKKVGLRTRRRLTFYNGEIECRLLEYELYAGSKKHPESDIESG